jgi:plasmid stability protein
MNMAQVLVRNLEESTINALKERAKAHHRSLQSEVKIILEESANQPHPGDQAKRLRALHAELFGKQRFPDSTPMIRKDRER